ncbi:helix-turn-helix domain-containing protein [Streptomyces olivaceus]|uniref:Helix-turn-helix domain-containing protein n=1 Tax=Streptomyces olivaceus TaxID=47716 RepID=A0ABS7W2P1_STROV|nr:helix-turn-helix domain-containing protein [Streptomyces olivaceus]MBZ6095650.1 helix-turn-helix domain-containing protein [Streptomyces olivaceus]MBZ6119919.1 helix-turn-helix domain-containing protein [Streptomyces olivaceus]MBZ6151470.1 helix-turn-helix domain-containing protein [Streptomyces olivaceus]MBZ6298408.1 helix-turn-helix domain-containing protein [Streptomyces olivaceus]
MVFPLTLWRMHRALPERPADAPAESESSDRTAAPQMAAERLSGLWPGGAPTAEDIKAAIAVLTAKHGKPVTGQLLAAHFGVSDRTGRRYLALATA